MNSEGLTENLSFGDFEKLKMGDIVAFENLVEKTKNMVFAIAYSRVKDYHIAEDITQDTYLKAYKSLNGLKSPDKILQWLTSIARNSSIDHLRKKKLKTGVLDFVHSENFVVDANEKLKQMNHHNLLEQILMKFNSADRELIFLRYSEGLSYKQIAEVMNMSVTAVGEKLCRLRSKISELLKKFPKEEI